MTLGAGRRLAEVAANPGRLLSEFASDFEAAIIVSLQDAITLTADQVSVSFNGGSTLICDVQVPTEPEAIIVANAIRATTFPTALENQIGDFLFTLTQDPVISTVDLTPPSMPPPSAPALLIEGSTSQINVGGDSSDDELSPGAIVGIVFAVLFGAILIGGVTWYVVAKKNEMKTAYILKGAGSSVGAAIDKAESSIDDVDVDLDDDDVDHLARGETIVATSARDEPSAVTAASAV